MTIHKRKCCDVHDENRAADIAGIKSMFQKKKRKDSLYGETQYSFFIKTIIKTVVMNLQ